MKISQSTTNWIVAMFFLALASWLYPEMKGHDKAQLGLTLYACVMLQDLIKRKES